MAPPADNVVLDHGLTTSNTVAAFDDTAHNTGHNFTLSGPITSSSSSDVSEKAEVNVLIPPENPIHPETMKRLVEVRTAILRAGIVGMFVGSAVGFAVHNSIDRIFIRTGVTKRFSANFAAKYPKYKYKLPTRFPKNSLLPTILFFGAMGSFANASVSGRISLNKVGDIWSLNSKPKSEYQHQMNVAKESLHKSQEDAFDRRITSIKEAKARKEELERWGPPTK